jgi:hypothetical protein
MTDIGITLLAIWHVGLRELLLVTAIGLGVFGLDDLFIDLVYFARVS